jgi:GT2 family glycosyltransferase
MDRLKFSIISLNWNGRKILGDLLDKHILSLLNSDYGNFEVIFADNGSIDDSVDYVKRQYHNNYNFQRLRVLKLGKNYGFSKGNNLSSETIDTRVDVIIFINNDTVVDKNWLRELAKAFEDQRIGIAQPLLKNFDGSIQFTGGFVDLWGRTMTIGGDFPKADNILLKFIESRRFKPFEVLWAYGACIAVRANLFQRIGGFNVLFRFSHEEQSVCIPVISLGFKVAVVPMSVVFHKSGASVSKAWNLEKYAELIVNRIVFILLYFPMRILVLSLLGHLILECYKSLHCRMPKALIKSIFAILQKLPVILSFRNLSPKILTKYYIKTPLLLTSENHFLYAVNKLLELNNLSMLPHDKITTT